MLFVRYKYDKLNFIGEWASDGVRSYTISMYYVCIMQRRKIYISHQTCHTATINGAFERSIIGLSGPIMTFLKDT